MYHYKEDVTIIKQMQNILRVFLLLIPKTKVYKLDINWVLLHVYQY